MRRSLILFASLALTACVAAGASTSTAPATSTSAKTQSTAAIPPGLDKLDHLIFIVQENRSFDHY
ncbi:MAG: hypothetical protein QOE83_2219, partial [Actinomycetota bacterium]|nr:hypothetical protein [Actinomycetota bacterium]